MSYGICQLLTVSSDDGQLCTAPSFGHLFWSSNEITAKFQIKQHDSRGTLDPLPPPPPPCLARFLAILLCMTILLVYYSNVYTVTIVIERNTVEWIGPKSCNRGTVVIIVTDFRACQCLSCSLLLVICNAGDASAPFGTISNSSSFFSFFSCWALCSGFNSHSVMHKLSWLQDQRRKHSQSKPFFC